jgi:hypothetical protein
MEESTELKVTPIHALSSSVKRKKKYLALIVSGRVKTVHSLASLGSGGGGGLGRGCLGGGGRVLQIQGRTVPRVAVRAGRVENEDVTKTKGVKQKRRDTERREPTTASEGGWGAAAAAGGTHSEESWGTCDMPRRSPPSQSISPSASELLWARCRGV